MSSLLAPYLDFCPENIRMKFCNGEDKSKEEWWKECANEYTFCGFLFRNSRIYVINIYLFDEENDYERKYLDVTDFFEQQLETFNIYHLCFIVSKALNSYYRESTLTEKLIPYIKYGKEYRLPKIQYAVTKHHNRYKKFIINSKDGSDGVWNQILHRAISKIENLSAFAKQRDERPDSLLFDYTTEPRLCIHKHSDKSPDDIPPKRKRKARRRFGAFNPERGGADSTSYYGS